MEKIKKIQIYKKELDRIKKERKKLTAKIVVEEAEDKKNPLHDYFEWDNSKAGQEWRIQQARVLINVVKYKLEISEGNKQEVYKYEIINTGSEKEYKEAHEILGKIKWRKQIVEQATRELEYWLGKYEFYSDEFGGVIDEIKKVVRRLNKNGKRRKNHYSSSHKKGAKGKSKSG